MPLKGGSPELLFLQMVRDTAHRFVLGKQRRSRKKTVLNSQLTSLSGVGPKTARLLWDRFGSLASMTGASLAEIRELPGVGKKKAEQIHSALQSLRH